MNVPYPVIYRTPLISKKETIMTEKKKTTEHNEPLKDSEKENKINAENAPAENAAQSEEPAEEKDSQEESPASDAEKLAAAQEEILQLKDKYLRSVAEFDNYRKRTLKEKTELILNGGEKVLVALLPILDDLERAQENMEKSSDLDTLKEGVNLIIDKLNKTLATQGLKQMETANEVFDTDFHEAVAMIPAPKEEDKNKIIDCIQKGYLLNEKVIRHAKVVVGQ